MSAVLEQTDHVGYTVSDLDRSVEFWSYLLQREPKARKTWDVPYLGRIQGYEGLKVEAAFFDLPGGLTLELIRYHNPPHETVDMETYNVGNAHLSFVTDNLHQTFERLRGRAELRSDRPGVDRVGAVRGRVCGAGPRSGRHHDRARPAAGRRSEAVTPAHPRQRSRIEQPTVADVEAMASLDGIELREGEAADLLATIAALVESAARAEERETLQLPASSRGSRPRSPAGPPAKILTTHSSGGASSRERPRASGRPHRRREGQHRGRRRPDDRGLALPSLHPDGRRGRGRAASSTPARRSSGRSTWTITAEARPAS